MSERASETVVPATMARQAPAHTWSAERVLDALLVRREHESVPMRPLPASRRRASASSVSPEDRAADVLNAAGATFLDARHVRPFMEITFRFMDERFICVIDPTSFQVMDAGICLSGHDRELGLDALPSVIREAIDCDHLNITRR